MSEISILIVDDEQPLANEAGSLFRRRGWTTKVVYDGPSAINCVIERSYDVILLDMRMTGMDGFATLREIREERLDACVVFFTAYGDVDTAVRALREGAWSMITKGQRFEVVFEAVNTARIQSEKQRLHEQEILNVTVQERLNATRTLAQSVTHQVINRLTDSGLALANLEEARTDVERSHAIDEMRESLDQMEFSVRTLHDIWRAESGELLIVDGSLADSIRTGWIIAKRRIPQSKVDLSCEFEEIDSTRVLCQKNMLPEVLVNLFHNSLDALRSQQGEILVTVSVADGVACVRVSDNGPGFPPNMLGKAHLPYQTSKGGVRGTSPESHNGMGLYFVKTVVEKSGGEFRYGNNPTGGAYVEFTLKLASECPLS